MKKKWFWLTELFPCLTKLWKIMRLCVFFLFLMAAQVWASDSYSQSTRLTLNMKDTRVLDILGEIEEKSEFYFLFNQKLVDVERKVDVEADQKKIEDILQDLFAGTNVNYLVVNRQIVLTTSSLEIPQAGQAAVQQEKAVSGRVTDQGNIPLPGVTVVIKGTSLGTITDADGIYTLTNVPSSATLVFSFVGMRTQEVVVNNQTRINIQLSEETIGLEEVIAVGYGVQKKTNLTGSVSEIRSDEIVMRATNSTIQALQGLAPNLNIDVNTTGGASDASMSINIRGIGSLSASNPYILINGVRATEGEFSALNPNDIQSISVLKDAASTAIYGAQAAYGVILVETKKGGLDKRFELNYSNNFRIKKRIYVPSFVNSVKYAEVLNIASMNYSGQIAIGEEQMKKIIDFYEGRITDQTEADPKNPNHWLGIQSGTSDGWFSGYANSDWWNIIFKEKEFAQKHDINASGGSKNIQYHISGSFFDDAGALKYGDDYEYFKQYNFDSYIGANITDWLRISNNTRFYQQNNSFPATLEGASRGRLYHDAMRFSPLAPYKTPAVKDSDGNTIIDEQLALMPGWLEKNGFNEYNENNFVSTLKAELNLTKDLIIKGDFSFKKNFYDRTLNYKKWTLFGPDAKPSITYQTTNNQILKEVNKTDYTSFNIYANYLKSFRDKHFVEAVVGYQQEENNFFSLQVARQTVLSDNLNSLNVAIGDVIGPDNPISTWGTLGVFGRLSYNYLEKYLFEFNGRYDGSSKFEEGDRFGFFPSAAVGYNIHKEQFWNSGISNIVNTLKIRVSYGKLGNQNVSSYLYLSSIPINTRLSWVVNNERPNYSGIPAIVSPDITWETSVTKNLGADMTFLKNRLSANFDIYERQTENMFGPSAALPSVLGTNPPRTNSASLKTNGWELTLGWKDKIRDFNYNVNLMVSDNKSTITSYHNPNKVLSNWYVGQTIGEIWGFEVDGLFQTEPEVQDYLSKFNLSYFGTGWQPGNVKYKNLNDDDVINIGDNTKDNPGDMRIIGNSEPRYRYSISGNASWKNIDFSMLWQGIGKRDYWPDDYATLFWGWNSRGHSNITEAVLDFWTKDNTDGYLPLPLEAGGSSGFAKDRFPSTRYLQSSAFIRLKSISLGYSIPQQFLEEKVKLVKRARIYFNGENLLTFSRLWENFDPELVYARDSSGSRIGEGRAYPLASVYGFGLSITF